MTRRHVALLFVAVILLVGCHRSAPPGTGIRGVVNLGPTCPVESPVSPCPDRPFQGDVQATSTEGDTTRVTTDEQGRFSLDLPAGSYVLVAVSPSGSGPPTPVPQTVQVQTGAYTQVTLEVDSGIR
jgi:hypothetical protein